MAHRARLAFKRGAPLLLVLLLAGCGQNHEGASRLLYAGCAGFTQQKGLLLLNGGPYTGFVYQLHTPGDTASLRQYKTGLLNGVCKKWYAGGQLCETRYYKAGCKTGTHTGWWPNGNKRFVFNYKDDLPDGVQTEWYNTGNIYQQKNYTDGYENGAERMWNIKGGLIANYVMRNGRKYGLTGVQNCVNISAPGVRQ